MLNYIVQVILFQVLFLVLYDLWLSKETFFTKNRWYLLCTVILSFVIPLLKIPTFKKAVPQEITILLPEVILSPQSVIERATWYNSLDNVAVFFWLGSAVFLLIFFINLLKIAHLIFKNEIVKKSNYNLVLIPKQVKAFSFFNYIFLGKEIPQEKQSKIIQHELIHSQQKHTADLLFFEMLKIIMWFNPIIWLYQQRITLVHEYISDAVVAQKITKENYINTILSSLFHAENISFINQFYSHSLIKKRIIMITKQKSRQIKQLKFLLLVPVLISMLFYTACTNNELAPQDAINNTKGKIQVNGKDYFLKLNDKGNTIFIDEYGYEIDSKTLLFENVKVYEKDNFVISEIEEIMKDEDFPFSSLDKTPNFPGCSKGDKDCFNRKIREHIQQNFDKDLINGLGLKAGKKRIYVKFRINKNGLVENISARAPHPKLKSEAIRITSIIPQLKPGEKNGKKVNTSYVAPITFNVK